MKANELMIGDWTNVTKPNGTVLATKCEREDYDFIEGNEDKINPVPITAEILEKNGLGKYMSFHFSTDECIGGKVNGYELSVPYRGSIYGITSIHELQHALRLCGLNDLADNFQI